MNNDERTRNRREPRQHRSRETVAAVLGAVPRVLARHGADALTTNRIAEAAGVSIGSLYQYFPDKQAIYRALHHRHIDDVIQVMERTVAERTASLEDFARGLVERLADLHGADPGLHELVATAVPEGAEGFKTALQATFTEVISQVEGGPRGAHDAQRMLFVLPHMIEALVHGVTQRPAQLSLDGAKREAVRTVLVYLRSCRRGAA
jgi:AcrR family transcriptional regulator